MSLESYISKHEVVEVVEFENKVPVNPLVSICVQTYNHVHFISQCLDSIISQRTDFDFEILLSDDDSADGTYQICEEYSKRYPEKIRFFKHARENNIKVKGKPTGRFTFLHNLSKSRGKFLAICDGDDYWCDPLKLTKQVALLNKNPDLIATHHWQKKAVLKEGHFIEIQSPKKGEGYLSSKVGTVENIFANQLRVKTRSLMFRNSVDFSAYEDHFDGVAFGDVPLSFILGKHGDFGFIDEEMAVYRLTDTGVSTMGRDELGHNEYVVQHFKNWIEIWDKANKFYGYKYHDLSKATISQFYQVILKNSSTDIAGLRSLIRYNQFERVEDMSRTLVHLKQILNFYKPKLSERFKSKLKRILSGK